jgi:RNA polymerase sigma-70 factor (ECF subfamily)
MEKTFDPTVDAQIVALRPAMFTLALIYAGNRGDAEDLVQSALAKALEWRGKFRPESNLKAWLKRVIRNLAIDNARHGKKTVAEASADELPAPPPQDAPPWANLSRDHVELALRKCSPLSRETFELHYFKGLSLAEIARLKHSKVATIGTRLHRTREMLRASLSPSERQDRNVDGQ